MRALSFTAMRREEPEFDKLWGLYDAAEGRWLPVVFKHRSDATEAAKVVNGGRPALGRR